MSAESVSHLGLPEAPPPPPVFLDGHKQHNSSTATKNIIDECLWAVEQPELQKACFLARVCSTKPPKCCAFRDITSILQIGPTCGLTALSMLLGGVPTTVELLVAAKHHHYTNNGEMFSARYLWQLICDTLITKETFANIDENRNSRNTIECVMHEGRLNCAKVRECLRSGDCLFVPYPFINNSAFFGITKLFYNFIYRFIATSCIIFENCISIARGKLTKRISHFHRYVTFCTIR